MELLVELLQMITEKKKIPRRTAAVVYHRDYVKTKNKPYRKYDRRKHRRDDSESS